MKIRSFAVTTLIAATALVPAPASASYYESGVSFSTQIMRDGRSFRLKITAIEDIGGAARLEVLLSSVPDPGGTFQKQTWSFDLEPGEFSEDGDGSYIDAGGPGRPLDVHVSVTGAESPCASDQPPYATPNPLYVTPDEGTEFRIETDNEVFGTITELPECGRHYSFVSGARPGPPPCPVEGIALHSALRIEEGRGDGVAPFSYKIEEERTLSGEQVDWTLKLDGYLEGEAFNLDRSLRGRFQGAFADWMLGVARFRPVDPLQETGWENCRNGREARRVYRHADTTGDLRVQVIGEEDRAVTLDDAYLERSWVRPRR